MWAAPNKSRHLTVKCDNFIKGWLIFMNNVLTFYICVFGVLSPWMNLQKVWCFYPIWVHLLHTAPSTADPQLGQLLAL
jgi:hypothetical protein